MYLDTFEKHVLISWSWNSVTIKLHSMLNSLLLKILNNLFFIFAESGTDMFLKQLETSSIYKHGSIIRTGTICKEIPLYKSIEFDMALK